MAGDYKTEYKPVSITFPRFYVCKDYVSIRELNDKKIEWLVVCDFKVRSIDDEWDELTIDYRLALSRKHDGYKIAELVTKSIYNVSAGMKYEHKYRMLKIAVNQTTCQAQGAWVVKNTNPYVKKHLPQAYNRMDEIETEFKERLYKVWE